MNIWKFGSIVLWILAADLLYAVMTYPAFAITGPALLLIAAVVGASYAWRRGKREEKT